MADKVATFQGLLDALIQQESSGNPQAVSNTGYVGLMQLHPEQTMESLRVNVPSVFDVAGLLGQDVGNRTEEDSRRLLMDPNINKVVGTLYLKELMSKYNWDIPAALTAYNAGPDKYDEVVASGGGISNMPKEEQRNYAADVNEEFRNMYGFDLPQSGVLVSPRPQARPAGLLGG